MESRESATSSEQHDSPDAPPPMGAGSAGAPTDADAPTLRLPAVQAASPQAPSAPLKPALRPSARDQCPTCASALAPDQRYCVECGQRLAQARPPFMNDDTRQPATLPATPPRKPRFHIGPNSALIAGIGTLLLAMGVGVLIGRSGQGSSKNSYVPIETVPSAGVTGTQTQTPSASAAKGAKSSGSTGTAAKSTSTKPTKTATPPANPTVTIGQKGTGAGYQHHKFTGHFFGGESEENAGEEEAEEKSSNASKGTKKK